MAKKQFSASHAQHVIVAPCVTALSGSLGFQELYEEENEWLHLQAQAGWKDAGNM